MWGVSADWRAVFGAAFPQCPPLISALGFFFHPPHQWLSLLEIATTATPQLGEVTASALHLERAAGRRVNWAGTSCINHHMLVIRKTELHMKSSKVIFTKHSLGDAMAQDGGAPLVGFGGPGARPKRGPRGETAFTKALAAAPGTSKCILHHCNYCQARRAGAAAGWARSAADRRACPGSEPRAGDRRGVGGVGPFSSM